MPDIEFYQVINADLENDTTPGQAWKVPTAFTGDPDIQWAWDSIDAALQWAEEMWPNGDYPEPLVAIVIAPYPVRYPRRCRVEIYKAKPPKWKFLPLPREFWDELSIELFGEP
jgi:hypothetical protein